MVPISEKTAAPQQHQQDGQAAQTRQADQGGQRRHRSADPHPGRAAWVRPDFEAVDTALEVTAYAARA